MSVLLNGASDIDIGMGRPWMQNVPGGTLMSWVTIGVLAGTQTVIGMFGNTGTTRAKFSVNGTGNVSSRANALDADATSSFNSTGAITTTGRFHIACVYFFSSKSGLIYINGVLDTAGIFANMTAGNTSNTVCAQSRIGANETGTTNSWTGEIEDCRVYNRVLGSDEIMTIYSGLGKDGILTGLQARWPMSDLGVGVAASNVIDVGGNNFDGVVGGSVSYQAGITVPRSARCRPVISP